METNGKIYAVIDTIISIKACITIFFVSTCLMPEILIWFSWNKKTEGTAKPRTFQQTNPYLVKHATI